MEGDEIRTRDQKPMSCRYLISCLEQSRTWHSERLDPNNLEFGRFRILAEKEILKMSLEKKKIAGNGNLRFYSEHHWILRPSELVSSFFQYNLQFSEKKGSFSNEDTCIYQVVHICILSIVRNANTAPYRQ